jgi:hypothetical protein
MKIDHAIIFRVRLVKNLSKEFLLVHTPEHDTSITCVRCFGECGPHPELKHSMWYADHEPGPIGSMQRCHQL